MPAPHDASEFVDSDFQSAQQSAFAAPLPASPGASPARSNRPPTTEELAAMVSEKQIKLAELKRAQEELERERAGLEELRRRKMEYQTGRSEMLQHLTRGIGLLEAAELAARRDAEQFARALGGFRDALSNVQSLNDQLWSQEGFSVELTRALTTLENARMEWNAARLKFPLLSTAAAAGAEDAAPKAAPSLFATASLGQLCKIGFALTWPLVLLGLAGLAGLVVLLLRH
jgi:DNA repair exonuclease SbcCD ATPase subunit